MLVTSTVLLFCRGNISLSMMVIIIINEYLYLSMINILARVYMESRVVLNFMFNLLKTR